MNRVRVKICGVRTLEEAEAAIGAGADALGFNFWPRSPRYVAPADAREIARQLAPLTSLVGVFVNEERQRVIEIASQVGLQAVQLHGDEPAAYCEGFGSLRVIKALRVGDDFDCREIEKYTVSMILLDTSVRGSYGGTGHRFDWRIATEAKRYAPLILAGGLRVDNVAEAIAAVRPAAIDVCSGIEAEPGRKDLRKLREFMAEVARANAAIINRELP
ncbi:MAG TPA: phosphoribosylanthranilate isomerase [Blastocatellia bacterium]|nr:phosphoribosylanthranilate isomerase [Blastocatellia bacterium]